MSQHFLLNDFSARQHSGDPGPPSHTTGGDSGGASYISVAQESPSPYLNPYSNQARSASSVSESGSTFSPSVNNQSDTTALRGNAPEVGVAAREQGVFGPDTAATAAIESDRNNPWNPGARARFPWLGALALFSAIACIVAIAVVMAKSHQTHVDSWRIRVPVLFAILSGVANVFIRFALSEGAEITWWTKALEHSSIRDLHYNWAYGNSLIDVVLSKGPFNLIRLASFIVTFIFIDGPLLQRALVEEPSVASRSVSITVPISPAQFVSGGTGIWRDQERKVQFYTPDFAQTVVEEKNKTEITLGNKYERGTYDATILAAGFDMSCNKTFVPAPLSTKNMSGFGFTQDDIAFFIDVASIDNPDDPKRTHVLGDHIVTPANIIATVAYKANTPSDSGLFKHFCSIFEAIVPYPIRIINNTVTLRQEEFANLNNASKPVRRPIEDGRIPFSKSTVGGFRMNLKDDYGITLLRDSFDNFSNPIQNFYANPKGNGRLYLTAAATGDEITVNKNPMPDMIAVLRNLAFRWAVKTSNFSQDADPDRANSQKINATLVEPISIYTVKPLYGVAAIAVMLLNLSVIIPTFHGYWHLGRRTSLSPIEIAKAFNAELLSDVSGNMTIDQILAQQGRTKLRYGVRHDHEVARLVNSSGLQSLPKGVGHLSSQWQSNVTGTNHGSSIDEDAKALTGSQISLSEYGGKSSARRLEFMGSTLARRPKKGDIFI